MFRIFDCHKKVLSIILILSPVKDDVVVNDRWGKDANCVHGDIKTCKDRYNPGMFYKNKIEKNLIRFLSDTKKLTYSTLAEYII